MKEFLTTMIIHHGTKRHHHGNHDNTHHHHHHGFHQAMGNQHGGSPWAHTMAITMGHGHLPWGSIMSHHEGNQNELPWGVHYWSLWKHTPSTAMRANNMSRHEGTHHHLSWGHTTAMRAHIYHEGTQLTEGHSLLNTMRELISTRGASTDREQRAATSRHQSNKRKILCSQTISFL